MIIHISRGINIFLHSERHFIIARMYACNMQILSVSSIFYARTFEISIDSIKPKPGDIFFPTAMTSTCIHTYILSVCTFFIELSDRLSLPNVLNNRFRYLLTWASLHNGRPLEREIRAVSNEEEITYLYTRGDFLPLATCHLPLTTCSLPTIALKCTIGPKPVPGRQYR